MIGVDFLDDTTIYSPTDIADVVRSVRTEFSFSMTKEGIRYFNVPCAFDIETYSFYQHGEKCASMYMWSFGIYGKVIIGRTWQEFIEICDFLVSELQLEHGYRLLVYVHNLEYEFQFFRRWFTFEKVFAHKPRTPIYALTDHGIEFRCSYILTTYKLETVAKNLTRFNIEKLVGKLDYDAARHSRTVLTPDELAYSANDVRIVMALIAERMELEGGRIASIPLTKTGYARRYVRNQCFYDEKDRLKRTRYREHIKSLTLDLDCYLQLQRAFQGGFTHASAFMSRRTLTDVSSYDITSSYPTVMVAEKFPMSAPRVVELSSEQEFKEILEKYCCLIDLEWHGVMPRLWYDHPLSSSKCTSLEGADIDNGRIISADILRTSVTDVDYRVLHEFYEIETELIGTVRVFEKGYLPKDFILSVLVLYGQKTSLKGDAEHVAEYQYYKEWVNSLYGMSVTDIVRDVIEYYDEWDEPRELSVFEKEKVIHKYNSNPQRFMYYPWGVWVTAYARRNLFAAIKEYGTDYVYSDTDSVKGLNREKHLKFFELYDQIIQTKVETTLMSYGIDVSMASPKRNETSYPLGVWDYEGTYKRFKTLGAKRYLTQDADDKYKLTVAGLSKKDGMEYLEETYGKNLFDAFDDGMEIPAHRTGKLTHTYIDVERRGTITDYQGVKGEFYEKSAVHMEKAPFKMSLSEEYMRLLDSFQTNDFE